MTPTELDLCQQCFERWPDLRPMRYDRALVRYHAGWTWKCSIQPVRGVRIHCDDGDAYNACRVALEDECLRRGWSVYKSCDLFLVDKSWAGTPAPCSGPTVLEACARALLGDEK